MFNHLMSAGLIGKIAGFALLTAAPALALETPADDKDKMKACEKQLCLIVLNKEPAGDDLKCSIGRTWEQSQIVDGVKEKKISWTFGDARCTVDINLKRQAIVDAMTKPAYDLVADKHTFKCKVERTEGITDVNVEAAPKMSFKDGKVEKILLNVTNIDAPTLIGTAIRTAATLEDYFGLFHSEMVKETNKLIVERCTKNYGS